MSEREITVLTDVALVTCVVQKGMADAIVEAAREAGAQGATVYFAVAWMIGGMDREAIATLRRRAKSKEVPE